MPSVNILGSVQIFLTSKDQDRLHRIITDTIPPHLFYYSPKVRRIQGDVTLKSHLTVCFGVKNSDLDRKFREEHFYFGTLNPAKILEVNHWPSSRHIYSVVHLVPRVDNRIYDFDKWLREVNDLSSQAPPFIPHITLCYLKYLPDTEMNHLIGQLSQKLTNTQISFSDVAFIRPVTHEKIVLTSLLPSS